MEQLNVYEIRLKVYLLEDIRQEQSYEAMAKYIDGCLAKKKELLEYHNTNCFKLYSFDQFYPVEADGLYRKDHIYSVRIRTVKTDLAQYWTENIASFYTSQLKGLTLEIRMIPKKMIDVIYCITPAIMKCQRESDKPGGYWRKCISFEEYENRLKINLIKKYNSYFNVKLDEDFDLYRQISFTNRSPVPVPYKGITLLGDKLCLHIAENGQAQELAFFAIGVGLCEGNSRGFGFVNYRYI